MGESVAVKGVLFRCNVLGRSLKEGNTSVEIYMNRKDKLSEGSRDNHCQHWKGQG